MEERQTTYKKGNQPLRDRRVINIDRLSPPNYLRHCATQSLTKSSGFSAVAISISDPLGAVESGEFDFGDTTSTDATPFRGVCLDDNHQTSTCEHVRNIISLITTRNRNFSKWRNQ